MVRFTETSANEMICIGHQGVWEEQVHLVCGPEEAQERLPLRTPGGFQKNDQDDNGRENEHGRLFVKNEICLLKVQF